MRRRSRDGRDGEVAQDMEFQQVVSSRRMVRNFESRPVPPHVTRRILENAVRAPSAGFTQGWSFLVLEGEEQTARFWDATFPVERREGFRWPGLFQAPLVIIPLVSKAAYVERYAESDKGWVDRDETRWVTPYWFVDGGCSSMLMLLTAVDQGLGALFFGIFDLEAFRGAFGVDGAFHPLGGIAIGYPASDEPSRSLRRGRRPLEDVVHWGTWTPRVEPPAAGPL